MTVLSKPDQRIPEFSGNVSLYRDFKRVCEAVYFSAEDGKQNLIAPLLLTYLVGEAWEVTRHLSPADLRSPGGFQKLFDVLDIVY